MGARLIEFVCSVDLVAWHGVMQDRVLESPNIRELVAREGKAARNLIAWSVPVATKTGRRSRFRSSRKPGSRIPSRGSVNGLVAPQLVASQLASPRGKDEVTRSEAMCVAAAGQYSGGQRAVGSPEKKPDLHCRYWWYLFDNLHRAVDEIYYTCEEDESIVECEVRRHSLPVFYTVQGFSSRHSVPTPTCTELHKIRHTPIAAPTGE